MEYSLDELFVLWWIFGYTWRVLLELIEEMEEEKYKKGHYKFTWL